MRFFFVLIVCLMIGLPIYAYEFRGSGATFPTLLFQKMFAQYKKETGYTVSYNAIGSGKGLAALKDGGVDFAISDIQECCDDVTLENTVHIPVTIGAVALIYQLPGNPVLKLSPALMSEIFRGSVKRWSDPAIQAENPGVSLPDLPIRVIARGDRSGTTSLLSAYLSRASRSWAESVGTVSTLDIKGAMYVQGNVSMVDSVTSIQGSIGYTEWHYAVAHDLTIAAVRNFSGNYVQPSVAAIESSLEEGDESSLQKDMHAYPITGYSYLVTHLDQKAMGDIKRARALVNLIWWMSHEGQIYAESLGFPPLSSAAMSDSTRRLRSIHYNDVLLH